MAAGWNRISEATKVRILRMANQGQSDSLIAGAVGLGIQSVSKVRRRAGIIRTLTPHEATPEQLADLRMLSNYAMQRKHGLGQAVWKRLREEHGIPHYRPPTVVDGVPSPWRAKPEPAKQDVSLTAFWRAPDPQRDHSVAGEAASFLQRERRLVVYNRAKIGQGEGWQVGRNVLDAAALVAMAEARGFERHPWMGEVA